MRARMTERLMGDGLNVEGVKERRSRKNGVGCHGGNLIN
jgi:hypothetical protein